MRWYGETGDVNPEIQAIPTFTGLQLVKPSTTLRTGAEGEKTYSEKIFRFRLRPQSEGQITIGAAAIQYKLPGAEKENYLSTTPTTYTVQPAPFSWSEWLAGVCKNAWFRGLGSVLLLGGAVCVTLLIKRRYKKVEPETVVEEINPVDEAFEEARRRRIEGDRSRFIRALKQAVQLAFAARFPDAASTDLSAYRDRLDMEARFIFDRFFETCEHIQFAPVSPSPDELDRISEDARRLTEMIK